MGQSPSKIDEKAGEDIADEKSMACNNCGKSDDGKALQRCSACQSVHYCSKECQKKHWVDTHKNECKEMAKAVPAWFPHAEPLLRVVKRTGLSRTAAVSLLERYRDANGVFPGQDADGMEAYAMSAWVMDLRRQIKNLDSKLEAKSAFPEAKKAGSVLGGWLGKKPAKEQATLESLHQEWVKGGKVKGATHESFFDTEYLLSEVKMQKEVLSKHLESSETPVEEGEVDDLRSIDPLLSAPDAIRALLVMGPVGRDRAKKTGAIIVAMRAWGPDESRLPEELAIEAADERGVQLQPWQVRAMCLLLGVKTASDKARDGLRKAALFQIKEQKRAMDLCRSMPGKVIEAMTCSECCKDLVMLSQDTRDGMNKYCQKAVNTPWVVGEQHFKMNEFLTSMDQVAEQLKDLGENEYAIKKQNPVHTEMIKCAYDRTTELCDEAWIACVNGAAGVLLPGDELPGLDETEDESNQAGDDAEARHARKQREMTMRLVEAYRTSTKMRVASDAYDQDESLQEALANFGKTAPTNFGADSDEDSEDD